MSKPEPFYMPISALKEIEKIELHPDFRTGEQFEAVRRIVNHDNFAFGLLHEPFIPDKTCAGYRGPFTLGWYGKDGVVHLTHIGKRGKILWNVPDKTTKDFLASTNQQQAIVIR